MLGNLGCLDSLIGLNGSIMFISCVSILSTIVLQFLWNLLSFYFVTTLFQYFLTYFILIFLIPKSVSLSGARIAGESIALWVVIRRRSLEASKDICLVGFRTIKFLILDFTNIIVVISTIVIGFDIFFAFFLWLISKPIVIFFKFAKMRVLISIIILVLEWGSICTQISLI